MAATAIVQTRLEPEVKAGAIRILAAIGMTPSVAVRLLFNTTAALKNFGPQRRRMRSVKLCKPGRTTAL